jgi:hypothetical protein
MIAWLFFTFLAIGIVLMIAGFFLDIPLLNLTGTIFLFILGLNLLTNGLEYKDGVVEVYHYGNEFTGEHWTSTEPAPSNASDGVYLFNKTVTDNYSFYDDAGTNRFGWFLLTLGSLAFALSMFRL